MTKKVKIFVGIASVIGVYGAFYFLVYRKRKPSFSIIGYEWDKKFLEAKFGNSPIKISEYVSGDFTAGKTFDEKIYRLTSTPLNNGKVSVTISKNGLPVESKIIDFDARLIIDKN